jgi:hypothetical protein
MATQNNVSPDAMSLNDRLIALHNAGHSWMDPTLQVHLATNGGSTSNMLATADTYKNVLNNTGVLPTKQYSDLSMSTKPATIQQLFSTLHNAYAPVPILTSDITDIQKNMQAKGYGAGLPIGTWNTGWQQALNQHATDHLAAPGVGNTKSLPLWKKVMSEIQPSGWTSTILHAVTSYTHHLPADLRQMISDLAGGAVADFTTNPLGSGKEYINREASTTSSVENLLGGKTTAADVNKNYLTRNIQDFGNLANLILLKGAGSAVAKSVGAVGKSLVSTTAEEGAFQAAKDLVTRSLPDTFAAAPRFTLVKSLYQAGAEGEKGIGFLRAFENAPVLKRILPAIDGLDAEGSRYYSFKNAMAQSMRIPLRQLGAQVQAKGSITGLGLLGASQAEKALGVTPTYDVTAVKPYSGYLGDALDTLGLFVGAPTQGLKASQNVGQIASAAHEAYSNALGAVGIDVPFRKGLGVSLDEFKKNLGEEFTNTYVNTKINQFAASHYAEMALQQAVWDGKIDRTSQQYAEQFMAKEHEALLPENVDKLAAARESLLAPQGKARLSEYFANEFKSILAKNIRKGTTESYDVTSKQKNRLWEALKNQKALQELGVVATQPEHRNLWAGSATMTNIQDHLTRALSSDWATKHPAFDQDPWALSNEGMKLYHVNSNVNEFAPDSSSLSSMTPYGKGIWSTENQNMVGRTNSNIFALQHNQILPNNNLITSEKISKVSDNAYKNMNESDIQIIHDWVRGKGNWLNTENRRPWLEKIGKERDIYEFQNMPPVSQEAVAYNNAMKELLNKTFIPKDTIVYRGIKAGDNTPYYNLKIGDVIDETAVSATSISKDSAMEFAKRANEAYNEYPVLLKINVPAGYNGLDVKKFYDSITEEKLSAVDANKLDVKDIRETKKTFGDKENEIILPATKFRVVKIEKNGADASAKGETVTVEIINPSSVSNINQGQPSGQIAKFLDLTKTDANSTPIKYKLSEMLGGSSGGVIKGTAGAMADTTIRQLRDELGLMVKGKTEGALVHADKETYTPEYKKLQKMLSAKFDVSGQDVLDAYRKALIAGGKLNKDEIDARIDNLMKSVMADGDYVGVHYLHSKYGTQTLLNPDRVTAKMVKQDPNLNVDSIMPNYLLNNNVVQRGAFGFARKDTVVAQDAYKKANQFMDQLAKLGHQADVEAARSSLQLSEQKAVEGIALPKMSQPVMEGTKEAKLTLEARAFLVRELGFSQNEVTRLDALQAVGTIWKQAGKLASEATLPLTAPKALKDVIAKADALGFRPVLGTDIGHSFENPLLHPVAVDQRTGMLRRAAMALGIDPTKVSDITTSMAKRTAVETELNKLFASGKVASNFGDTGNSIYSTLLQGAQSGLYAKESRIGAAARGFWQGISGQEGRLAKQAVGDIRTTDLREGEKSLAAARDAQAKAFNQAHQIRDLSLKQMVKILTRPVDPLDPLGSMAARYTPEDAMKIAKSVLIGYAKSPTSLLGLGKAEDFIRASNAIVTNGTASFFGKVPVLNKLGIGEGPLANAFASLPNDLARARDKWRFDMNPVFAFRRLAKTNVKAAAEGVPPTRDPYEALSRLGVTEEAFNTLNRTMPDVYRAYKDLEPLDKFLQQADVFNVYNPAHMMAWQAHNLEKLGLSDAEITQKLTKINTYGDRTPLERTVNTIFYPFSFNKTLYRSVGGYLLDHPGETMLINAGFNLYSHYDPNNDFGKWVTKHLPVLNELKKLNAFEHGTGLGQFGGINAPYINQVMNLFSPQMITPKNAGDAIVALKSAIPALAELNTLLFNYQTTTGKADFKGSAVETGKVGFWAAQNLAQHALDMLEGHKRQAYQTTLTDQAQVQAGQEVVTSLKTQLAPLMNSNAVWADKPEVPAAIRGMKFNSTSFGLYAQSLYPAFDPTAGAAIAIKKNSEALKYLGSLQGTFRYDAYKTFTTLADKAISKLRNTNDPTVIQSAVNPLRAVAVNIAEQDPKFVSFYKRFYSNALGPIEGLSK